MGFGDFWCDFGCWKYFVMVGFGFLVYFDFYYFDLWIGSLCCEFVCIKFVIFGLVVKIVVVEFLDEIVVVFLVIV